MSSSTSGSVLTRPYISYEGAMEVVNAGLAEATAKGVPSVVAVLDPGGNLVAFGRQDGAPLIAGPYAIKKAWTSASIGQPTQGLWDFLSTDNAMLTGIVHDQDLLVLGGGLPLSIDGEIAGAVGVSGGTYQEDDEIAHAAAAAFG
jgi:uncharacterized protein GlcG (DUF336 family)